MPLESLICNSCGAPLKVPERTNYVRCNHCGIQLAIHRTGSETFTESLEQLTQTTTQLSEQVSRLVQQNQLADLDREWEREQQQFMISNKDGHKSLPTESSALVGGIFLAGFGTVWTIMVSQFPGGGVAGLFPCFGVLFIGFGIMISVINYQKARGYRSAHRRYLNRRSTLVRNAESDQVSSESIASEEQFEAPFSNAGDEPFRRSED